MSLIKQLWLAIGLTIAFAFGASFLINMISSQSYLEEQLGIKNTDNATSLALSISQMEKDPVTVELMLSAQFDHGHYAYIKLADPNNQPILEKVKHNSNHSKVPVWFKRLIPIVPSPGIAQIQDGWQQYGSLTLASTTDFAYLDLWDAALSMLLWSIMIALACGALGSLALKFLLSPLHEMVKMTDAIGDKNFISIQAPNTLEFKSLAAGLNRLSARIKETFNNQSVLLDQMRLEANYDDITGLMNRKHFSSCVSTMLEDEQYATEGLLVVSRISNLSEINEILGESCTNNILQKMGQALTKYCNAHLTLICARLGGADFAVFSNKVVNSDNLCQEVRDVLNDAANLEDDFKNYALPTVSCIVNQSSILDNTFADIHQHAKASPVDIMTLVNEKEIMPYREKDDAEWVDMLNSAIKAKRFKLAVFPVTSIKNKVLHYESPSRIQLTENGDWLTAGEFVDRATKFGLITQLDGLALEAAIDRLKDHNHLSLGLNVSVETMLNAEYLDKIKTLTSNNPKIAQRLWLEVSETAAFEHIPQFKSFCETAKKLGCKVGVEHIGLEIGRLGELLDIGLDYLKIDAAFVRDIDKNHSNQAFLRGICLSAHSIGLLVIAEGVHTEKEIEKLATLDFDAMTGPAVKENKS